MKHQHLNRQQLSDISSDSANHGGHSIKDIFSIVLMCLFGAALAYMFFVKQVEEIDRQADIAAEYHSKFKESENEPNY